MHAAYLDQEFLEGFVVAWFTYGSVLGVAAILDIPCDDVIEIATTIRPMGVNLPAQPRG